MIKEGMFYKPSMNNSQGIDEVLILVTDVRLGKYVYGVNILNQCEDFEYYEDDNMGEPFEYYYDIATNGDVAEAVWGFKPRENTCIIPKTECNGNPAECDGCSFDDWWNAPYQKGGKE